jgi:hypothetical protein
MEPGTDQMRTSSPIPSRTRRIARKVAGALTGVACAAALAAAPAATAAPSLPNLGEPAPGAGQGAEYELVETGPRGHAPHRRSAPNSAGRCRPSIEADASEILAGEPVTVSGTLQCDEGTNASGQTVTLYAHSIGGAPGFSEVAAATSEAGGSYVFTSPPLSVTTIFLVRTARGHSPHRRVRVAPSVSVSAPRDGTVLIAPRRGSSALATNTVTFAGTVTPASPYELVILQRERPAGSGSWHRIAVSRLDEAGHYTITHTFKHPGKVTLRVLVRSTGRLSLTASQPVSYEVAP